MRIDRRPTRLPFIRSFRWGFGAEWILAEQTGPLPLALEMVFMGAGRPGVISGRRDPQRDRVGCEKYTTSRVKATQGPLTWGGGGVPISHVDLKEW